MGISLFASSISPLNFLHQRCVTLSAQHIETPLTQRSGLNQVGDPNKKNNAIFIGEDTVQEKFSIKCTS